MADSREFGYVNAANFRVFIDKIPAFEKYLRLAVDTILSIEPERNHISGFCVEHSYKNRPIPKNWESDSKDGGYWETKPIHYWLDESTTPLEICTLGSGEEIDIKRIRNGRMTFANQEDLIQKTLEITKQKDFERDVLPYIPSGKQRGNDINEYLLNQVLSRNPVKFDMNEFGDGEMIVTGEDLRGEERIGYTIIQRETKPTLDIGLCKAYYPR